MDISDPPKPVKVFVSYSHDSQAHRDRVLALCNRLREDGVDADVDQYEPSPPEGWPRWMNRQITSADFVILVCTETYCRRFEGREERKTGLGVAWEGAIVTQEIYKAAALNDRFIPITFSMEDEQYIPGILGGVTRYCINKQEGYEALYRRLTDQPEVPRPKLGPARSLPPRPRASFASSPLDTRGPSRQSNKRALSLRLQRGSILFFLVLGIAAAITLITVSILRPKLESMEMERRSFPLTPRLTWVSSVARSPDGADLIIVGRREPGSNQKLFKYSLRGNLVSEILNPSKGGIHKPTSAQREGDQLIIKDEDVFVSLDKRYQRLSPYEDLLTQSPTGSALTSAFQWMFVGRNLFVLGDVQRVEGGEPQMDADADSQNSPWERGVVHVPVEAPDNFLMVRRLATDKTLPGIYLIGYPQLASVNDKAYFLEMKPEPEITCLHRETWRRTGFTFGVREFDRTPDFAGLRGMEAYNRFENSALAAGLYGWRGSLYVLSKCPTIAEQPTRWFLTRLNLEDGTARYTLSLPVSAPHLMLVPGDDVWVILEKGPFEVGTTPKENKQETSNLVLVLPHEIDDSHSSFVVENNLPLCSYPARWNEETLRWDFYSYSGTRPRQ